ncbi:PREDICTED: probable plastid-lipid-associated protein 4, chloroplastic isoform X3 [Nelumbo nucifera]|uniref:Probable plastid-lipid-associated protein 4, chloroplastic isoform X3 n=1 Tax=Nelumbo nucifera TaxID=4432 RepID=A0A1U7ZG20_NELNU|nr:PREDICTED: probable plastid-lipid-associated protein 4, chloroplastic isoform X3 [Nelumbo nucifera]
MAVVNASCIASASVLQAPIPSSNDLFNSPISAIPISSFSFRKPIRLSTKPSIDSELYSSAEPAKWRTKVSFFQSFLTKTKDSKGLKEELLETIAPLDRGAEATPEAQARVDQVARKLEAVNEIKEPLKSNLLSGKWELLYTTSKSILKAQRPKFLRPNGKIYQAINVDTLRAQNMETWPFFNQATANLVPINAKRVAVKFDSFKIASVVPIKARGSGRGQLEITYLDEELRISRGNEGNLFILKMVDPSYRVPV